MADRAKRRKPSYRTVNYSMRPAKAIERKMIVDVARRLDRSRPLNDYQYVGFGSPYFTDFSVIHRNLGIDRMVCIEREAADENRFRFNLPFAAVDLIFKESGDALRDISWGEPTVMWLDYDGRLDLSVLDDISYAVANLSPGSLFLISVNVEPNALKGRRDALEEKIGAFLAQEFTDSKLGDWGTATACWVAVNEKISMSIAERNLAKPAGVGDVEYQQVLHLHYDDGSKMLTVGGLVSTVSSMGQETGFNDFVFTRSGRDPFLLKVPSLTFREMQFLDSRLPSTGSPELGVTGIPEAEAIAYEQLYRYFPKYADVDF